MKRAHRTLRAVSITAAGSLLALAATVPYNLAAADTNATNKGVERVATVVWQSSCIDGDDESGIIATLIGIFAPKLVDFALGAVTDKLSETSEEFKVSHIGKAADSWGTAFVSDVDSGGSRTTQTEIDLDRSCIIVHSGSAGRWGDDIRGRKEDLSAEEDRAFYPASVSRLPKRPALFFMAEIDYMEVGQRGLVFRVVPLKFAMNRFTARGSASKDIVGTIRFSMPNLVTQGGFTVDTVFPPITNVAVGDRMEFTNLTSDWISFPKLIGKSGEQFPIPASVRVTVLETDTGSGAKLFSTLADAIKKNQGEINKAILDSLSSDSGDEE
ncbi:MAG: hypothetical protein QNI96_14195 [Woeseiaceae bacterium]|nr:hypothetical protein [Woeseiaceae bacterium]